MRNHFNWMRVAGILALWMVLGASSLPAQTVTPSPALVVLNKADSQLAIIDPATLKVVAKVGTGNIPHEVVVSPDGKIAVATNYGPQRNGTTISVIDLVAQKELHRVDLPGLTGPHGAAFFNGKAYITVEGSKAVAVYNPATNTIEAVLPIGQDGTHMLVPTKDGRSFYTANIGSNSVTAVKLKADGSLASSTNIPVGKGPEGIDISPDGKEVWAANSGDGSVSIIDTATGKLQKTFDVGTKHSNRLKFTPDGKLVLLSDLGSGELLILDAATRKELKRLKLGISAEGILITPDGARAFVAVSGDNKVAVIDLKSLAVTNTFQSGSDPDGMAWAVR